MKIEFLLAILPCLIMAYILYANDTKEKEPFVEILKAIFNGDDYDEHYYLLKSLSEELNDIKIILNMLGDKNNE